MRWLLLKDLQILRRSPLLVALLVIYPIAIALLIGLSLSGGPQKPRVAIVDEIPPSARIVSLGKDTINVNHYTQVLAQSITPVYLATRQQALAEVSSGKVLAALIIPPGTVAELATGFSSSNIEVIYNGNALQQSLVATTLNSELGQANAALAHSVAQVAASYVDLLQGGGTISLDGAKLPVLGLRSSSTILREVIASLPRNSAARAALMPVNAFTNFGVNDLGLSKQTLVEISAPLTVTQTLIQGKRTPLDTFAVAVAVAISLMFVSVLLAAGMLALEREDHTYARLVRGLVSREALLGGKILLAGACAFVVTLAMVCGIAIFVPLEWSRFPLWLLALAGSALAFATLGVAIGSLAREVRAASLLAFLLSLPLAFLALVPAGAVSGGLFDVINVISAVFPFKAALEALDAAINGSSPSLGVSLAHLGALIAGFGVIARLGLRRFA